MKSTRLIKEIKENINRKSFHVNGLDELILLKCLYHVKLSIDSM